MMLNSRKKTNSLLPPEIMLNGTELKRVHSYKYLGIMVMSNILWTSHITISCNKTRRFIVQTFLSTLKPYTTSTLTKLYCSFICPYLEYASIVWNPGLKGEWMLWRTCKSLHCGCVLSNGAPVTMNYCLAPIYPPSKKDVHKPVYAIFRS